MTIHPPAPRQTVLVLLARPVRRRSPSATSWRLLAYDTHTRAPLATIAEQWEPAGTGPHPAHPAGEGAEGGMVPDSGTRWDATVLQPDMAVSVPADRLGDRPGLGRREPAGCPPVAGHAVPARVLAWLSHIFDGPTEVGAPANLLAGPSSWYVHVPFRPHTSADSWVAR